MIVDRWQVVETDCLAQRRPRRCRRLEIAASSTGARNGQALRRAPPQQQGRGPWSLHLAIRVLGSALAVQRAKGRVGEWANPRIRCSRSTARAHPALAGLCCNRPWRSPRHSGDARRLTTHYATDCLHSAHWPLAVRCGMCSLETTKHLAQTVGTLLSSDYCKATLS